MSGFPSGGEALGSASFGLRADGLSEFQREMTQAGNAVDRFGDRAADAVGEDGRKGGKFLGGLRSAVKGFRSIIGIAGGVASAITIIAVAIGTLVEVIENFNKGKDNALDFMTKLGTKASDARGNFDALQARIDEIQSKLAYRMENPIRGNYFGAFGEPSVALREELASLQQSQRLVGKQIQTQQLRGAAAPVATFGGSNSPAALQAILRRGRGGGQ